VSELGTLGWLAPLFAAVAVLAGLAAARRSAEMRVAWERHVAWLEVELRYQAASITGEGAARSQAAACAVVIGFSALFSSLVAAPLLALSAFGPTLALRRLRAERTERIEAQLGGFLLALAHSLKATPALGDGLRCCADVVARPLADELRILLHEHELGTPLDRALESMSLRIGSPVVSAALSTLRIARGAGGDFVHTLEQSAATLREMARLEGVVRTKTAEGRAQTIVVSLLPFPTLYLIDTMSPELLEPLWSTDLGHILMAIALLLWVVAFLAARRITQVDI
jgi:tight adherence protein B